MVVVCKNHINAMQLTGQAEICFYYSSFSDYWKWRCVFSGGYRGVNEYPTELHMFRISTKMKRKSYIGVVERGYTHGCK